jgi:hypothetical protein
VLHKADCDYYAGRMCNCASLGEILDSVLKDMESAEPCDGSCQGLCDVHEDKCAASGLCAAPCDPKHDEGNVLCQCHDCYMADPESWTETTQLRWSVRDLERMVTNGTKLRGDLADLLGVPATSESIFKAVKLLINNTPTRRFDGGRGTVYLNVPCSKCGKQGGYGSSNIKLISAVHGKTVLCHDCEAEEMD